MVVSRIVVVVVGGIVVVVTFGTVVVVVLSTAIAENGSKMRTISGRNANFMAMPIIVFIHPLFNSPIAAAGG